MSISLYQKYLLLDQIVKRAEALGATLDNLAFGSAHWETYPIESITDKTYSFMHHVSVSVTGLVSPEGREAFTEKWLAAYPDTELVRVEGRIFLRGDATSGLRWHVTVGTGVCERVQVGTKTVQKIDPDFLVNVPMIDVEEPIFEVRCPDPLRELVAA